MSDFRNSSFQILRIARDFLVILACLQAGKAVAALLPFRFPDSILGLLFLFVLLNLQLVKLHWIEKGASLLLKHMALLFIPVAVGLLGYIDIFMNAIGVIALNIFAGLCLILLIVGRLFQRMNQ
ncbi:MAG: CidA/LrgA family protein [Tolumonas sp.]|jgi:holin-like protein|uniref:CidA/LrgA family protein n=1 Tax=uncultured Tolumonas sp. TaxID=263765 RepID=UPI002A0A4329|nr:CidA/LrgA family protein [uncultured Tolumonas sp.]MDD2343845.1 CidA/LrgA family protein [Tolumonas sp.]MDD2842179.1 CidA/LrgA family protein [Tolumonas sp.]